MVCSSKARWFTRRAAASGRLIAMVVHGSVPTAVTLSASMVDAIRAWTSLVAVEQRLPDAC